MNAKTHMSELAAGINLDAPAPRPRPVSRTATTVIGDLAATAVLQAEVAELTKKAGAPRVVSRDLLRPSPYQVRKISPAAIAELAENLRHNPLTTPIVVRPIGGGLLEIVAGHRRDAAFDLLGRNEMPAIVVELSDEQAEAAVFYDNFFPPDICDYEKYLGLQQIRARAGYSHEQLAERSGISASHVGTLMSFERLPAQAREILSGRPNLIGAAAAAKLAQLPDGSADRLAEGLLLVADGTIKQAGLYDWVIGKEPPKRTQPTVYKSGRNVYAKILRRDGRLTIDFSNVEDAASLESEIGSLIKARAAAKK